MQFRQSIESGANFPRVLPLLDFPCIPDIVRTSNCDETEIVCQCFQGDSPLHKLVEDQFWYKLFNFFKLCKKRDFQQTNKLNIAAAASDGNCGEVVNLQKLTK